MDNFTFCSPTKFIFGKDTHKKVGEYVKRYNGKKVLLHYGGGSIKKNGVYDDVVESLRLNDIDFVELGGVQPNPVSSKVYEGIDLCKAEKIDFILAVGGGSVIDSSKAIAAGVCYDGDFLDFYKGIAKIKKAVPVATVLTIPAAGSEGSPNTVITDEKTLVKCGAASESLRPVFSVMNPALCFTLPVYQSMCGCSDIMAHIFERYFTNTKDVEITDRFCEAVLHTIIKEAPKVKANSEDYEAQANIMWAGMVAHNNICGVGRQQDWGTHAMEHQLSAHYGIAHGAGLAIMFPAWMKYVVDHDVDRFAQIAVRVWGCEMNENNPKETALAGIAAYEKFLKSLDLPLSFADIDAKEEDIPKLISTMGITSKDVENPKHTGNFVPLYAEDVAEIYKIACK
ncbi:MAG: iron-containing alcohol dehydrogenase [Bacillota bacterium]|jgi:alcohol dehydrogenase YqhD (iron-dependent ADH family)